MKFWDTIAKMCGIEVYVSPSRVVGQAMDSDGCYVSLLNTPWTARAKTPLGALTVTTRNDDAICAVTINDHGVRLRDTERDPGCGGRFVILGTIAIERIRPMRGKSGDVRSPADAITDFARKTWKYESAADKPS